MITRRIAVSTVSLILCSVFIMMLPAMAARADCRYDISPPQCCNGWIVNFTDKRNGKLVDFVQSKTFDRLQTKVNGEKQQFAMVCRGFKKIDPNSMECNVDIGTARCKDDPPDAGKGRGTIPSQGAVGGGTFGDGSNPGKPPLPPQSSWPPKRSASGSCIQGCKGWNPNNRTLDGKPYCVIMVLCPAHPTSPPSDIDKAPVVPPPP
jgi:hypothetical protein